jgi:hypothetical protein
MKGDMVRFTPTQEALLKALVEATQMTPAPREWFLFTRVKAGLDGPRGVVRHDGLPGGQVEAVWEDIAALRRAGLLEGEAAPGTGFAFTVSRHGFRHYGRATA